MFKNIDEIEALTGRLMDKLEGGNIGSLELEIGDVRIKLDKGVSRSVAAPRDSASAHTAAALSTDADAPVTETESATVNAPLIGIAYAAPSPDSAPFVKVGDKIKKGDVVCIIEAMKVMNEIESDRDGEVAEILFENGKMVEFGSPLISLK